MPGAHGSTSDEWFDTSTFSQPVAGQKGNSKRNQVVGPPLRSVDLSLFKTFRFASRYGLELRFECFNVTNTPQYAFRGRRRAVSGASSRLPPAVRR